LLIANGITGVREMYSGVPARAIHEWKPRTGAPMIAAPGFVDGPMMLNNGPAPPGAFAVANADQARFAVHALAEGGADFLKVYSSIPRDAYFALAEEAKKVGIPFAGHVPEAVTNAEASDAGQRSMEHLINILLDCSVHSDELRAARVAVMTSPIVSGEARLRALAWPDPDDGYSEEKASALFKKFVENHTWQTPTLVLLAGFVHLRDEAFLHDPRRKYLLKQWTDSWDPRASLFLHDLTPEELEALHTKLAALLERYKRLVADMHRAGVEFLAGTDASGWTPVFPGSGVHEEMSLLVDCGFSPMEALQAATRNPARYFRNPDRLGTIEVNKEADLVLLNANPLEDIRNTQRIEAVVMRGRYYARQELDAMVKTRQ
jgi:hypothetical protein